MNKRFNNIVSAEMLRNTLNKDKDLAKTVKLRDLMLLEINELRDTDTQIISPFMTLEFKRFLESEGYQVTQSFFDKNARYKSEGFDEHIITWKEGSNG